MDDLASMSLADIAQMAEIAKEAAEAGALGFSTSRTLNHRTSDGQPTPTLTAAEDELTGIALGPTTVQPPSAGVLSLAPPFQGRSQLAFRPACAS